MTFEEFRQVWNLLTEEEQQQVKDKAAWEHCTLSFALKEWFPEFVKRKDDDARRIPKEVSQLSNLF